MNTIKNDLIDSINYRIHYLAYGNKFDLLQKELDISKPNLEGDTVAHIAAKMKFIDILLFSIKKDPTILFAKNKLGCTPLFYLVPDIPMIKNIVLKHQITDHKINNKYTLIEYYILTNKPTMVYFLLDNIITINKLLVDAAFTTIESNDNIQILQKILDTGLDINSLNSRYLSMLIVAVYLSKYPMAKFLLKAGINLNYAGPENSDNPLSMAIQKQDIKLVRLLIDSDLKLTDKYFRTPVHYLFIKKNNIDTKIKKYAISKIKDVNACDNKMNSILNLIIKNDNWLNYRDVLVEKKLAIYLKNKYQVSPIDQILYSDLDKFFTLVYKSYINQLKANTTWLDKIDNKIASLIKNNEPIDEYKSYIIKKINSGQSYPLKKSKDQKIKFIQSPETNITHFTSYTYNYICYLYYILQKYPTIKIPAIAPKQLSNKKLTDLYNELATGYPEIFKSIIKDYINHSPILINHIIIWQNEQNNFVSPYMIKGIKRSLQKYPTIRFIVLKITIIGDNNSNHANILLLDCINKVVERFDPYGNVKFIKTKGLDDFLTSLFVNYKYVAPVDSVNGISFQVYADEANPDNYITNDPTGYCLAWCMLYIEMRIKNYELTPAFLIKETIKEINKNETNFKDYIRNYSNVLDKEKNKIFKNAHLPKKYWYTTNIPENIYLDYLKHIRKLYYGII